MVIVVQVDQLDPQASLVELDVLDNKEIPEEEDSQVQYYNTAQYTIMPIVY